MYIGLTDHEHVVDPALLNKMLFIVRFSFLYYRVVLQSHVLDVLS